MSSIIGKIAYSKKTKRKFIVVGHPFVNQQLQKPYVPVIPIDTYEEYVKGLHGGIWGAGRPDPWHMPEEELTISKEDYMPPPQSKIKDPWGNN